MTRRTIISVLEKMIAKDLLKTLAAVWTVIVVVIVSRSFIRVLDKAIEGRVSSETLLSILSLKTITTSTELLPAALFMAVLMVLGRMYRDQEMSAIFSAGGGPKTVYRAVFLLVLPLSVIAANLSLYTAPWAEAQVVKLMQHDEDSSDLRGIAAGKFSEYSQGDLVLYVESISADKIMHQLFVQTKQQGIPGIINAKFARVLNLPEGRYINFEQGERVLGKPGSVDYVFETFTEYAVKIEEKTSTVNLKRSAENIEALWQSATLADKAELQRRFFIPLSLVLFAFLGVPLAQTAPRGGVYGNILIGFLIYFVYGNLARLSQLWVSKEAIPVWLGSVGANAFLLLAGLVLLAHLYGWRWLMIAIRAKVSL